MPAGKIETMLNAMLGPENAAHARMLAPDERAYAASAILAAFRSLRRGDEKLQDLCHRIGVRALISAAAAPATGV